MIYFDFEYNDRSVILCCALNDKTGARRVFDLRHGRDREQLATYVRENSGETWASYSAMAELSSLLRLGIAVRDLKVVCLLAEASMISGTHAAFRLVRPSLYRHLEAFALPVPPGDKAHKDAMRDLIIHRDAWSDAEWQAIVSYCWEDVDCLPGLFSNVEFVHRDVGTVWELSHAEQRGEYLKASAILDHRSRGLPIDVAWLNRILDNRHAVRNALAEQCNAHYGHELYVKRLDKLSVDENGKKLCSIRFAFNHKGLEAYLETQPFREQWELTATGKRRTDDDYLDDLIKAYPQLTEFKRVRNTLAQLKDDDLRQLVTPEGFIRPVSIPFYTVTGRNQPLVKRGFVLNLPPWLRTIVRPKPGHVLIAADYSKQEIGIAVALSGDAELRAAYETGDIYLALAERAGAGAEARQAYKSVQLGLGFGMGLNGLSRQLYVDLNQGKGEIAVSPEAAGAKAGGIYRWHKRTFKEYWSYLEGQAKAARADHYTTSADGWFYFADKDTKQTQLMNVPMQGNGAAMLRDAIRRLAFDTDLDVVCSLHDAVYAYCRAEDAERVSALLTQKMTEAAEATIGEGTRIDIGITVYTAEGGYFDKRGKATFDRVKALLDGLEARPIQLTELVEPKRRTKPKVERLGGEFFVMGEREARP